MNRFRAVLVLAIAGAVAFVATASTPVLTALHIERPVARLAAGPAARPAIALAMPAVSPTASPSNVAEAFPPYVAMTAALTEIGHNTQMRAIGSTMNCSVDPANNTAMAAIKDGPIAIDEIVSHDKIYVRAQLGSDYDAQLGITDGVWMTMDPTQIKPDNQLLVQPDASDPVDLPGISAGITSIRQVDKAHLAGIIDLTKVTGHTLPDPDEVAKAGAAATSVPFAMRADASGRISEFSVAADGFDPALSLDVLYTDYGSPSTITPPSSTVSAPVSLYGIFNH